MSTRTANPPKSSALVAPSPSSSSSSSKSSSKSISTVVVKDQVRDLYDIIREERNDEETTILAVVPNDVLPQLTDKCRSKKWKFWHNGKPVELTTQKSIQSAVDTIVNNGCGQRLVLVVSEHIDTLNFDVTPVGGYPHSFGVIRGCRDRRSGKSRSAKLILDGSSTFDGIRLDQWTASKQNGQVFLGPNVHVRVHMGEPGSLFKEHFSSGQVIRSQLSFLNDCPMIGKWWKDWQGPISSIIGLAATTVRISASLKTTASGFYLSHSSVAWGTWTMGASHVTATAVMTAAGPAALLGAGAAAAVYFFPWEDFFLWLGSFFGGFFEWLMGLIVGIRRKIADWSSTRAQQTQPEALAPPPPYEKVTSSQRNRRALRN
ncbi:hypothetical protein MN608_01480 [Microdochium nivale]|nr:hypothetical protein MN608_01480 [Microdochium nivale]